MIEQRDASELVGRSPRTAFVLARRDDALGARIVRSCALRYRDAAELGFGRPPFVRAASGFTWVGT